MIVTVIVILQIVAAILGFVFSDNVAGFVDDRIFEAIRDYRLDTDSEEFQPDVNQAVDFVQDNVSLYYRRACVCVCAAVAMLCCLLSAV